MAIKLTYYTLVIPTSTVLSKFPDGWAAWVEQNESDGCGACWCDEHLFARATMSPLGAEKIQSNWQQLGFIGKTEINGEIVWKDFCFAEQGGRCDWLSYSDNSIHLTGREPGLVVGPWSRSADRSDTLQHHFLDKLGFSAFLAVLSALTLFVWSAAFRS